MAKEINIKLSAEHVVAKAGEKVRIKATFDQMAYASVNERRDMYGYQNVIRTQEKVQDIDILAEVHSDTTDFIIMTDASQVPHLNENANTVAAWYHVTVGDDEQPVDLGNYQYSVGLISDLHICAANGKDSDWWDEDDFKAAMEVFVKDQNVKFVAACGDIAESMTNDDRKHPEATCDADYALLKQLYDVPYWQVAGIRLFSPLGNHDFYGLFESRYGDIITGKKNTETTYGYNQGVQGRIASLWPTGQQINGIPGNGRSRIIFDLEKGKNTPQGQADMNFFAYNAYVDLYAKQAGYTGKSIWDSNKGGINDEAIRLTKDYVTKNWEACKDRLSGFADTGLHGRNGYSKLSYYLKKDNNIYVFLSIDYGDDVWGVKAGWHDRMIHARTIINLNSDDPYIRRMKEYVEDYDCKSLDYPYNYQYYSVNALIWLKELIEANADKKIFVFTHHYMPNRVGNSVGIPKDGAWQYADIHKAGELTKDGINIGSNCLTGIQFWFIDKLIRLHRNVVWFSGHSHISYEDDNHIDNHNYGIVDPATGGKYAYTKANNEPTGEAAWSVALPSLSKPKYVSPDTDQSQRLYEDAEFTIMEVYERGIRLKGYKLREDNHNVFDANSPLMEQDIQLI